LSPKIGSVLDLFGELVYFTRVFPHANLTIETPLVDIEEWRYPGHGKRRRWKWRAADFQVEDQRLVQVHATHRFRACSDLLRLLPAALPAPFHSGHLADALGVRRFIAQRIAYCLREMKAIEHVGKQGNSLVYRLPKRRSRSNDQAA
jgi:hypothetical protein